MVKRTRLSVTVFIMENTRVYIKVETGLYVFLTCVRDSKALPVLGRLDPTRHRSDKG